MKNLFCTLFTLAVAFSLSAQRNTTYKIKSPDGSLEATVNLSNNITWSVSKSGTQILSPSAISMTLQDGTVLGSSPRVKGKKETLINTTVSAAIYKRSSIADNYRELALQLQGEYGIIFRAYNTGIAYRFTTAKKSPITILSEQAEFNFTDDHTAFVPYVNTYVTKNGTGDVYINSFENTYNEAKISELNKDTLAFVPILVSLPDGKKAAVLEADLEDYPGMFLKTKHQGFYADFAPYPKSEKQGGHNNLQSFVTERENFIARTQGSRSFPWRILVVSNEDKELLNNDLVYLLATPSRIKDASWIKPGKVAWDWWNDWNIKHVDFKAGINTATYKYYIDFAAANNIEYVLLDEGWANSLDIMDIVPEINLQEIIDYGKSKNVGIWLWGGWLPLNKKMDEALNKYATMGIKGFKVDFMDRDDQKMVNFYYRLAEKAAQYKLMIDYHGAYKPTGLQRTYPNVITFEGVYGLEQMKWGKYTEMPEYDATIPFIRMLSGPMDYTPGAMRNVNKQNYRPINSQPMSQGTRCHQLAMYIVYESPFSMLSDNPNAYMEAQESTDFIASLPTVFDETVALDGKVGEYAVIARRKGNTWYIGGINNWTARDITIDLSFLGAGNRNIELFTDGVNAHRDGTDYKKETKAVNTSHKLTIHMAPGGGFAGVVK